MEGGVFAAVGGAGEGAAGVPAYEVGEVAVCVVRCVEVEFPFLELVVAADVDPGV